MMPTYELTEKSFEIKNRTIGYMAVITCDCMEDELKQLVGQPLKDGIIVGYESLLIPDRKIKKGEYAILLVRKDYNDK